MPGLSFFADNQDALVLLKWLNAEPELAFIVKDETYKGPHYRWKAVQEIDQLVDGKYSLWHIPGGSLPLISTSGEPSQQIQDPWSGWLEHSLHPEVQVPYFGAGHNAEICLNLHVRHQPYTATERTNLQNQMSWYTGEANLLPISDLQWIGDRYGVASQHTWQCWQRMTDWILQNAVQVQEQEDDSKSSPMAVGESFLALPSAFEKLNNGMACYAKGRVLAAGVRLISD